MSLNPRQPKAFPLVITIALFERLGFYIISFLLALYLTQHLKLDDRSAFATFGVFTALAYLTPIIGGYLADQFFGLNYIIIIGLFIEGLGIGLLAIPDKSLLYLALALIIAGVGLFKTAPLNLLARSYASNDPRIDSGFTIFYMVSNIGSFLAPLLAGFIHQHYNWPGVFICASIALYLSLLAYFILRRPVASQIQPPSGQPAIKIWLIMLGVTILTVIVSGFMLFKPQQSRIFFIIAGAGLIGYFVYQILKSSKLEKIKIICCLLLILIGMIFFVFYFQLFISILLFIDRCVQHKINTFYISTPIFLALNPFWIIVLSPLLVKLYNFLEQRNKNPRITTKFVFGLLLTSMCFLVLTIGTLYPDAKYQISGIWIVIALFLCSLGELLISALGPAMIVKIAPQRMYGVMMGTWYLIALSLGSAFASMLANLAQIPKTIQDTTVILHIYGKAFFNLGLLGIVITSIIFLIIRFKLNALLKIAITNKIA